MGVCSGLVSEAVVIHVAVALGVLMVVVVVMQV